MRTMLRDRVTIGQTWMRRRDKAVFVVRQVHRTDRQVVLRNAHYDTLRVGFAEFRSKWTQVDA